MCRKLMYLAACVVVLGLITVPALADIGDGLVGYWPLDEGSGGMTADASGNANDGTINGGPGWVAGMFGNALEFDGSDDHVDLGNPPILDFGTGDFTISAWVKTTSPGGETVVAKGGDNSGGHRWRLYVDGSTVEILVDDDSNKRDPGGSINVIDGEWRHLVGLRRGDTLRGYVDAVEDPDITAHGESTLPGGYDLSGTSQHNAYIGCLTAHDSGDLIKFFAGAIDDVAIWNRALDQEEIDFLWNGGAGNSVVVPSPGQASNLAPADEAIDVLRDLVLSWTPGEFAVTHDVYLGTTFADVNAASADVLVSAGQDANSYDAGRLEFGQTYFWRVDEVNGAPDNTVFAGDVSSFTVEPVALPVQGITATASGSNDADMGPEKTIDGSGLDDLDQHSTLAEDMWLSAAGAEHWIQYEFDKAYKLHEMWVWNSNQMIEAFIGLGAKDVIIETSLDGAAWTLVEGATQFAQAPGLASYTANTIVDFGGAMAQFVRITINAGWGALPQYGLSEVRFFSIPVQAREPQPADGASTDGANVVLKWRAGREAASHEVSLGTDSAALTLAGTTDEASLDPGALDYGTTYYWRVDEVNLAETPATHTGNVWSFTTPPFGIVDDFDQYDDNCMRIFFAWEDGLGHNGGENVEGCEVPASNGNGGGSIVGNDEAPFAEQTIVTTGSRQSLPFNYDNSFGPSEATLTLDGQDWTASGVQTLSLAFYGTADNTGTLYVKINNTKVSYDLDPTDIARPSWQAWNIDLTALSGLENVTKLTIGVDGGSAAGMLYIDDIRLYPQAGELITPVQPSDAGLLTHLAFDEGAGAVAGDSSGNGHGADLVGPPQWVTGKLGGALQFGNGSHVLDDDAEDYLNGLEALTISVWVKSGVTDTDQGILLAKDPSDQDNTIGIRYDVAGSSFGGSNVLKLAVTTDDAEQQVESSSNLQTTEWQHICMTWASGGLLRLYVDGTEDVLTGRNNANNTGPVSTCEKLIIGKGGKDIVNSAGWDGLIDEVRIYGRALSAEEVMGLAGRTQAVHKPL